MQAAVQHHVGTAVAKAINLMRPPPDVRAIYLAARQTRVTARRAVEIHDACSGGCHAHVCGF